MAKEETEDVGTEGQGVKTGRLSSRLRVVVGNS
jgi:hypothetical protein